MPILFPVNRIEEGKFEFEGRKYVFPINEPDTGCHLHGFLHEAEFEVVEQGGNFIKCRYDSDELYSFFPHKFRVEINYSLSSKGMLQETYIYNRSDANMPVFLGFHTTFNVPFDDGSSGEEVSVFAEVGEEIELNMDTFLPIGRILPSTELADCFQNGTFVPVDKAISKHYRAVKDGKIELIDAKKRIKIKYDNDSKFGWRLFYNGDAEQYICLEPQTCMVNCQNSRLDRNYTGFDFIPPKACKKYFSRICVEEMKT